MTLFGIDLIHGVLYLLAVVLPIRYARVAFHLGFGMCFMRFLTFGLSPEFVFPLILYVPLGMTLIDDRAIHDAEGRVGEHRERRDDRRNERYQLLRDVVGGNDDNDHNPRNQNDQHNAVGREPEYNIPQAPGPNNLWPPEAGPGEGQFQNEYR